MEVHDDSFGELVEHQKVAWILEVSSSMCGSC